MTASSNNNCSAVAHDDDFLRVQVTNAGFQLVNAIESIGGVNFLFTQKFVVALFKRFLSVTKHFLNARDMPKN